MRNMKNWGDNARYMERPQTWNFMISVRKLRTSCPGTVMFDVLPDWILLEGRPDAQNSTAMLANIVRNWGTPSKMIFQFSAIAILLTRPILMVYTHRPIQVSLNEVAVKLHMPRELARRRTHRADDLTALSIIASLFEQVGEIGSTV
jgi:hypothetical protein